MGGGVIAQVVEEIVPISAVCMTYRVAFHICRSDGVAVRGPVAEGNGIR